MGGVLLLSPDREDEDERAEGRVKNRADATSEEMGDDEGVVALRCGFGTWLEWEVLELAGEDTLLAPPPERTGVEGDEWDVWWNDADVDTDTDTDDFFGPAIAPASDAFLLLLVAGALDIPGTTDE